LRPQGAGKVPKQRPQTRQKEQIEKWTLSTGGEKGDGRRNGNQRASGDARRHGSGERERMNPAMAAARANRGGVRLL